MDINTALENARATAEAQRLVDMGLLDAASAQAMGLDVVDFDDPVDLPCPNIGAGTLTQYMDRQAAEESGARD